ncbi:MAG: pilus assembly protein TadG-related protein [Hyphomicrobiaceae bacterium]
MTRSLFARFGRDRSGVAFIIFALTAGVLIPLAGGALDYGQTITVRERLAAAADATALAITGPLVTKSDETEADKFARAERFAKAFLKTHYPASQQSGLDVTVAVTLLANGGAKVVLTSEVKTNFLRLIGISALPVNAVAETSIESGSDTDDPPTDKPPTEPPEDNPRNIEVVLVLDVTGSMNFPAGSGDSVTKIAALKKEARKLTDKFFNAPSQVVRGQRAIASVKIGLVPFAESVNVGTDMTRSWLDLTGRSPQHSEHISLPSGKTLFDVHKTIKDSAWAGCVRARPEPYDTSDAPPEIDGAFGWVPILVPDIISNPYLKDVEPKQIGVAQDFSRYQGKTATVDSFRQGPNAECTPSKIIALTDGRNDIKAAIDSLASKGGTAIPQGLVWGWRVISPSEPFTEGSREPGVEKIIILLTDGQNNLGTVNPRDGRIDNATLFSAYGFSWPPPTPAKLDEKTEALCESIKADGIELRTITFGSGATEHVRDLMNRCASNACTGDACNDHVASNADLNGTFTKISDDIIKKEPTETKSSGLRLVK